MARFYGRLTLRLAVFAVVIGLTLAPGATLQAQTTMPVLRLGTPMSDDYTPLLYAIHAGLFKKAGIDVQVTVLANGSAIAAAVAGGALDIGKASLVSLMNAHAHGVPIVLVAAGAMYNAKSPYAELVMPADATYKTGKDLAGKTIGVPAIGDFNTLVTSMWVDQNGGDSKTLKFVEIPNTAEAPAVAEKRIDAAVLQQPDLALALETGKVKVLGLAYSAISPNFMFAGWFAMDTWASAHPDLVKTFQRVAADAARYTNAHHADTVTMLADASKMPLATIEKMSRVDTALTLDPNIIQPIIDASAKYKLLPRAFPAKELIFEAK
jgi:NitT/TauT family transport system substrate-binding protein